MTTQSKRVDFVLDWETIGTSPDAVVLSLAVIPFDPTKLELYDEYVARARYWKFDVTHQLDLGRTINQSTLDWWDKQDPAVKRAQFTPSYKDVTLTQMILEFNEMMDKEGINRNSMGWCRGTSFDFPLFANVVNMVKDDLPDLDLDTGMFPCPFWNQRDIRSYLAGVFVDAKQTRVPLPKGVMDGFKHHDPVHDCARAVLHIMYANMYADGSMDIPDDNQVDPNSNK